MFNALLVIAVEWTPEGKKLTLQIPAATRRLYANEMVDKSYTRYGITDDAQRQIVPVERHIPVDVRIPGCPPRPSEILNALTEPRKAGD